MSSVMRCRRGVMGDSFAKWNELQAATLYFRRERPGRRQAPNPAAQAFAFNRWRYANTAKRFSPENKKPIEGITALEINLGVVEIIEAAKESIRTGRAVKLK